MHNIYIHQSLSSLSVFPPPISSPSEQYKGSISKVLQIQKTKQKKTKNKQTKPHKPKPKPAYALHHDYI